MTNKFKVGDKVKYNDFVGEVIETNSGAGRNMYLCRFYNFNGHNGNGFTVRGRNYETNDYYYVLECHLSLIESTTKKEINQERIKFNMRKITDIRTDSKIVTIPQKKAAPLKCECQTVVITLDNGTEYESVCMPGDEWDLNRGIELALLYSAYGGRKNYLRTLKDARKLYDQFEAKREEEKRIANKKEKEKTRKAARKARWEAKERQARIDEMSEAFLKAMNDYGDITDSSIEDADTLVMPLDMDKICSDYLASKGLMAVPDSAEEDDMK